MHLLSVVDGSTVASLDSGTSELDGDAADCSTVLASFALENSDELDGEASMLHT